MAEKTPDGFAEAGSVSSGAQFGGRSGSDQLSLLEKQDAVRELFDFLEGVGGEKERSSATFDDFNLEEAAEIGGGERIEAAGGFVKEKDGGFVEEGAGKSKAVGHAGGESAHLAVELPGNLQPFGGARDSLADGGRRKIVHGGEECKIFTGGKARVKTFVAAGVIAELFSGERAFLLGVVAADEGAAACGNDKSGEDAQEGCLSGAVRADQGDGFAAAKFEADAGESALGGAGDRVKEGAPSGAGRRKVFLEIFDYNGRVWHPRGYNRIGCGESSSCGAVPRNWRQGAFARAGSP